MNEVQTGSDREGPGDDLTASIGASRISVVATASARLSSSVTAHDMSGVGTVSAAASLFPDTGDPIIPRFAIGSADSEFRVLFELDTPQLFDFSGLFTGTSGVTSRVELTKGNLFLIQSPPMSSGEIRGRGPIPAGLWRLRVEQFGQAKANGPDGAASEHGQFSFAFDLTPTPEPASLVLLGSGLLGLVGIRRRRSTSP